MNLHKAEDYFLLPVSICQIALQKRLVRELQVFLAMKVLSSGILVLDYELKAKVADMTGVSVRTIENSLRKLKALFWISQKANVLYLRSFERLQAQTESDASTCVRFEPEHLQNFRPFLVGTVVGYLVNRQKHRERKEGYLGLRNNVGSTSTKNNPSASYRPVALSVIATVFICSMTTASRYKNEAIKCRFLKRRPCLTAVDEDIRTALARKKYCPEQALRRKIVKGKLVEVMPDLIMPLLTYKVRKKWKHNNGGIRGKS